MAQHDADLRFRATLDDEASPQIDKLVANLKRAGATPTQIQMTLRAIDDATPKIKEAQRMVDQMPKEHRLRFLVDKDEGTEKLQKLKDAAREPVKLNFVDNLREVSDRLFSLRSRAMLPAGMPGSNLLTGVGAGAGILGGGGAALGLMQQSIQVNSQMEQSLVTLSQTLKDNTAAQGEMGKIVGIAMRTPFQYQDVLSADVRLRSYGIPAMPGEGGPKNPQTGKSQGWLQSAGDMAAAMNTPITQAVEAIADARQGYFVRMMSYGIRMMREDFQAGGRYQGLTYEQGLERAIRRFQGAQEAQSKTFQGVMSNIKDVIQQQVVMPIGAGVFQQARSSAFSMMNRYTATDASGNLTAEAAKNQEKLANNIQKVQDALAKMFEQIKAGREYFKDNLQQPLENFAKSVISIGKTFGATFGGVLLTTVKTLGEVFMGIAKPVSEFVSHNPKLVQIFATFKALSLLGFTGPSKGLHDMAAAINPLHPSITGLVRGMHELTSGALKIGMALIVKGFVDAHSSVNNLHNALKHIGEDDSFDKINSKLARTAALLGESTTNMRNLYAQAAQGLPTHIPGGDPANVAMYQARAALGTSKALGISGSQANRLITQEMQRTNHWDQSGVDEATTSLRALKSTTDDLKTSFQSAITLMNALAGVTGKIGMGGLPGSPYLASMAATAGGRGFISPAMASAGIRTPQQLLTSVLGQYGTPSTETIGTLSNRDLSRLYNFRSINDVGRMSSVTDNLQQDLTARRGMSQSRSYINRMAPGIGNQIQSALDPGATKQDFSLTGMMGPLNAGQAVNQAKILRDSIADNEKNIAGLQDRMQSINSTIGDLSTKQANLAQATDIVNQKMSEFQHQLQIMQRPIEDLQLQMQRYQLGVMRPLEREMTNLSNATQEVSHQMSNAQYSMGEFNNGLIDGEQAALNQLHAMERYNRQLQILQLQYQQIGAQVGTTVYERGFSSRVNPLMGLSMEMQMQQLQRKQQMKQLQYEDTYGEGHYQMQQAARTQWQRTEMPLSTRLKNIKENVSVIDEAARKQQDLGNAQFDLQQKMNAANKVMQTQQDRLTGLQIAVTDKQLHGGLRELQDAQFNLSDKTQTVNRHLNVMQQRLSAVQDSMTKMLQQRKDLGDMFREMLVFDQNQPAAQARRSVQFAYTTGVLGKEGSPDAKKRRDELLKAIEIADRERKKAQQEGPIKSKADLVDTITKGIAGFFTGESWRKIGDITKNVPGVGAITNLPGMQGALTAMTGGLAMLTLVPAALHVARQVLVRAPLTALARTVAPSLGRRPAGAILRLREGLAEIVGKGNIVGRTLSVGEKETSALRRISEGGAGREFARILGGGGFKEGLSEAMRFIMRGRGLAGAAIGSLVGGMVGGPVGSLLGGFAGARYARSRPAVLAAEGEKTIARDLKSAASTTKNAAVSFHNSTTGMKTHISNMGDHVKTMGKEAGKIGSEAGKIGTEAKKIHLRGVGRFGKAIGIFAGAIALFQPIVDGLHKLINRIPGVSVPRHRTPPSVTDPAGDTHGDIPHEAPGGARGAEATAARRAARRGGRAGGRIFRFANKAFTALAAAQVGSDLLHGDVKGALDTGSYLIPGVGDIRALNDVFTMADPQGTRDLTAKQHGTAAHPMAMQEVNRSLNTTGLAKYMSSRRGDPGNLAAPEARILKENEAEQYNLAKFLATHKLKENKYNEYVKKLEDLQTKHDSYFKTALKSADDDSELMTDDHHKKLLDKTDQFNTSRLKLTKDGQKAMKDGEAAGFSTIYDLTDKWLTKTHHRINSTAASLGVATGPTDALPSGHGAQGASTAAPGVGTQGARPTAEGGATHTWPSQYLFKGKGDSKGYLARVGEEGDELIVPLAPHRRDRAKGLIKHAAGMLGMAAGGMGGSDPAYDVAKNVYRLAAQSFAAGGVINKRTLLGHLSEKQKDFILRNSTTDVLPGFAGGGHSSGTSSNTRLHALIQAANAINSKHFPYLWGGGHSASSMGGPYDCSGAVSAVLRASGYFKPGEAHVSGDFMRMFAPGAGEASIYANPSHVYMTIGGRGWGTSLGTASHGGAGWFNGGARPGFVVRHLPGLGSAPGVLAMISAGVAGATGVGASIVNLPKVPQALKQQGGVGLITFRSLQKLKRELQTSGGIGMDATAYPGGGNAVKASQWISQAMRITGVKGSGWLSMLMRQASRESSYDPNVTNTTDINAQQGNPSRGLLQVTGSNFRTYGLPGHNNILNPVDNAIASIRYIIATYGHGDKGRALASMMARGGGAYATGAWKIPSDNHPATLHRDEMVLPAHIARYVRGQNTGGTFSTDPGKERKKVQSLDDVADIRLQIRKLVEHIKKMADKADKSKDVDHLAQLNDQLRKSFVHGPHAQAAQASKSLQNFIYNMGDKSGGEGTAAKVAGEKSIFQKEIIKDNKLDQALVKYTKDLLKAANDLVKTAHGKTQTHLATIAVTLSKRAVKSATAVTKFTATTKGKAAVKEVARAKYVVGAARRGVNEKLIASITGKALSKVPHIIRDAHGKAVRDSHGKAIKRSESEQYKIAAKMKPGAEQNKALAQLQRVMNAGLSKNAQHLLALRATAHADAARAASAVGRAAASQVRNIQAMSKNLSKNTLATAKSIQSGNKVSSKAFSNMIKDLNASGAQGRKLADHLLKVHGAVVGSGKMTSTAIKSAGHHAAAASKETSGKVSDHIKAHTAIASKGHDISKKNVEETKNVKKSSDKSDDKRSKAEIAADKRERDYQKEHIDLMRQLLGKDTSINIHNEAHGATLTSTVTKSRTRAR